MEPIGELFAVAALRAMDNGRVLTEDSKDIRRDWGQLVSEHARVTVTTAYRSVQRLQDAGIIAASGKVGGVSVWVAPDVLGHWMHLRHGAVGGGADNPFRGQLFYADNERYVNLAFRRRSIAQACVQLLARVQEG